MSGAHELAVREKQELANKEEKTIPGRYFVPTTDVFETDEALTVIMEMPGVAKDNVSIALENDVLRVDGQINFSNYEGMEPVYTEYNVGHYARGFTLSGKIDRKGSDAAADLSRLTLCRPRYEAVGFLIVSCAGTRIHSPRTM
jgi:HSP20 family molecular chaperone IbpA